MGYFDNAATTPLMPEVKEAIVEFLDKYGNPSSTHYSMGQEVRNAIEDARESVAKFINADPSEITFTSGGSASNTLGIMGFAREKSIVSVFYSSICHKSIRLCCEDIFGSEPIPVDKKGRIIESELKRMLESDFEYTSTLVVLSMADSEIGTIQDTKHLIEVCHEYGAMVLCDATGFVPSYPVDVKDLGCDMLTFSAHKLGALKGVGVLYKTDEITLAPLVYGVQERGLFGGTENVIGIVSLGMACSLYKRKYGATNNKNIVLLWETLLNRLPDVELVGTDVLKRLPHNLFIKIRGIVGEEAIGIMDEYGYQISAGSACNTGSATPSPTLLNIGMTPDEAASCVRITLSGEESEQEIKNFCDSFVYTVEMLRWLNDKE